MEVELRLVGAILDNPQHMNEVIAKLKPAMFQDAKAKIIYTALVDVYDIGKQIDSVVCHQKIRESGHGEIVKAFDLEKIKAYLTENSVNEYCQQIANKWVRKSLKEFSIELNQETSEEKNDVYTILERLYDKADQIYEGINSFESYQSFFEIKNDAVPEIVKDRPKGFSGVPTGLKELDDITSGFQGGNLIILAARPGMGKSAIMTTMIKNASEKGFSSAVFSLEMSKFEIFCRLVSENVNIGYEDLTKMSLTEIQKKMFQERISVVDNLPIFINDSTKLTITSLKSELKQMKKRQNIDIAFVDYLQLMSGDNHGGNREQEISRISRGLKQIAKELNIPIIALSQLSRKVDEREGHRPYLSDLRESGSLEQDANMVLFLYRPYYYLQQSNEQANPMQQKEAYLSVAKNRSGRTANIELLFEGEFSKFHNFYKSNAYESFTEVPNDTPF